MKDGEKNVYMDQRENERGMMMMMMMMMMMINDIVLKQPARQEKYR